jgi:exocyst complex component 2
MTDYARMVLEHYQLTTPFPTEWPAEKDTSDASDDEDEGKVKPGSQAMLARRKSRFSALERVTSDRKSMIPGAQKTGSGADNLVQRDEPDPLGSADSVVMVLRKQGLPVQDDIHLRMSKPKISGGRR